VSEIAASVYVASFGRGALGSNVYFVRSGESWVLIDAGWPRSASAITHAAESLFGHGARPAAIALTHIHPDHSGSAGQLARLWRVPVCVHPDELPLAAGQLIPEYANPLDRRVIGPLLRLIPHRRRARMETAAALTDVVRGIDESRIPELPDWECVATPGHTPGHVSFYRRRDGVLITGDAVLTVDLNSVAGILSGAQRVGGPPRYTTWRWPAAAASIARLAALRPEVIAPGHGRIAGTDAAVALEGLARRLGGGEAPHS
jgi:glyoxylase-like metal-dependent hydrolase (beta-lactamase superfamily II)